MENNIDEMLNKIDKQIEISETQYEKAKSSYEAVGNYLINNMEYDAKVFAQGSFKLGTVIKPISDRDEYDIDLVALIDHKFIDAKQLKNFVGDILKNSERYSEKIKEGKRCWTIDYAEDASYHIDILPTMKSITYARDNKIIMTNKNLKEMNYEFMETNPEAYYNWFIKRMQEERKKLYEEYAINNKVNIEEIPEYKIKTKLQIAIEIVKRYRDIKFKDMIEIKPISIILTTIMAEVYTGNESVYELIKKFSEEYMTHIEKDKNGNFIIRNPVNIEENFADKWQIHPERKKAFFEFMRDLKKEIINNNILLYGNNIDIANEYKRLFGEEAVNRVYENMANETKNEKNYVNENGNVLKNKTNIMIRKHNFYGK